MKNKLDMMFESDFVRVPRPFIRKFNLNTAVLLSEIYSEYTYWKDRNELQQGGWFYSTVENIYYNSGLSKHQQLVACKELESYGIIKIKYHGMPKKRYFKFDSTMFEKLYNDFELNANTSDGRAKSFETEQVEVETCVGGTEAVVPRKFSGFSF
jgi:hypothetical protein